MINFNVKIATLMSDAHPRSSSFPETASGGGNGNVLSRKFFASDDFEKIITGFSVDRQPVIWEVGVPMLDDRPAVDDELLRAGRTVKHRANLGMMIDDSGRFVVSLSYMRKSRYEDTPLTFKPPVTSGVTAGIFSEATSHRDYMNLWVSFGRDGSLGFYGNTAPSETIILYEGNNPHDTDYERTVNFLERMVHIPVAEGQARRPVEPADHV